MHHNHPLPQSMNDGCGPRYTHNNDPPINAQASSARHRQPLRYAGPSTSQPQPNPNVDDGVYLRHTEEQYQAKLQLEIEDYDQINGFRYRTKHIKTFMRWPSPNLPPPSNLSTDLSPFKTKIAHWAAVEARKKIAAIIKEEERTGIVVRCGKVRDPREEPAFESFYDQALEVISFKANELGRFGHISQGDVERLDWAPRYSFLTREGFWKKQELPDSLTQRYRYDCR